MGALASLAAWETHFWLIYIIMQWTVQDVLAIIVAIIIILTVALVKTHFFPVRHKRKKRKGRKPNAPADILITKMEFIMSQYLYTFKMPPLGASDVVDRELHTAINSVETIQNLPVDNFEYKQVFDQDVSVSMFLIDIDKAGNRSAPGKVLTFQVVDTVAPDAPEAPEVVSVELVVPSEPSPPTV